MIRCRQMLCRREQRGMLLSLLEHLARRALLLRERVQQSAAHALGLQPGCIERVQLREACILCVRRSCVGARCHFRGHPAHMLITVKNAQSSKTHTTREGSPGLAAYFICCTR